MKGLTKIYIDLSKLSEEQRKHIFSLLPKPRTEYLFEIDDDCFILCYRYIIPHGYEWIVCADSFKHGKQEITYPEFIKLFEGGEDYPGKRYQPLFNHLNSEHGLILH